MARHDYDRDIAVTGVRAGHFSADLHADWTVAGSVNGGYLLGVVGNAARAALPGKPDLVTLSACYLGPGRSGTAELLTDVKRDGGSLAVVGVDLAQDGQRRLSATAILGDLDHLDGDVRTTTTEPELPPVAECVSIDELTEARSIGPLYDKFELRFPRGGVGWATGAPTDRGEIAGWFRFRDDREPDTLSLVTVCDLLPPAVLDLGLSGWAPTLELTVHVRARPAPGWLKVRHAARHIAGDMFDEDCEIWDSSGRLVAQSRQLARLPRPKEA